MGKKDKKFSEAEAKRMLETLKEPLPDDSDEDLEEFKEEVEGSIKKNLKHLFWASFFVGVLNLGVMHFSSIEYTIKASSTLRLLNLLLMLLAGFTMLQVYIYQREIELREMKKLFK